MSFAHCFCTDSDRKKIVLSQTSNLMVQKRYSALFSITDCYTNGEIKLRWRKTVLMRHLMSLLIRKNYSKSCVLRGADVNILGS